MGDTSQLAEAVQAGGQGALRALAQRLDHIESELRAHDCDDEHCKLHVAGRIEATQGIATMARQASHSIEVDVEVVDQPEQEPEQRRPTRLGRFIGHAIGVCVAVVMLAVAVVLTVAVIAATAVAITWLWGVTG